MSQLKAFCGLAIAGLAGHAVPHARAADLVAPSAFPAVEWRLVGPHRGGWSTTAVGVPTQPDTFYAGTAGGGIWETQDAGRSWRPISDAAPITAVGSLAVAPSDPNVLYAGTGEPAPRYDVAAGSGVYRSGDAGRSWQAAGLDDTRHIGALLIDPRDADVVLAAAVGHMFGPNSERGVFRSSDGGAHWTPTLRVDAGTGAVDLAADPANPDNVYAVTWTARIWPWLSYFTPIEGPGSAIYRSQDGGRTWARLRGAGWPQGDLGRIGIAVTRVAGAIRLYACVSSKEHGGLYRSDDGGAHWLKVHDAPWVTHFYMSRLTVSPSDPNVVYTIGQSIHESRDAGQTFEVVRGAPGGDDFHFLWINPRDPSRRVAASDQGATVSVNGGATWSDWYNQPTGQFYYLATDNRFPYWIYSGQQDSGTVAIASRSDYGAIGIRDWHPVGGEERNYDLPDPEDENIVFGSGLGGRISRWHARSGDVENVSPWPVNSYGKRPTDYRYHYNWFTPIAFSKQPPYALYAGAQVLFRSLDRGTNWEIVSPALNRHDASGKNCSGGLDAARAAACGYGVINTIVPAARDPAEIWIGTDDGLVWLTRDGAKNWRNVTPAATAWAKISSIDLAANSAGVAYVAIDNHRQDDFRPRVLKTSDYGASWTDISAGLPSGHFVSVVRADPVRPGLLYAGTEMGVAVSFDDGAHWQSLQRNLPPAWVHDLLVKDRDLVAATNGRAIWVLDDLSPLRQVAPASAARAVLYAPAPAWRLRANQDRGDTPPTPETPLGRNPPTGAVIDYWLGADARGPVVLEVRDAHGNVIRSFSSDEPAEDLKVNRYFSSDWLRAPTRLSAATGAHRFIWDLHQPRPKVIEYVYGIGASLAWGTPILPEGPLAMPGEYRLALLVDGQRFEAPLTIKADPRVTASAADYAAAVAFTAELSKHLAQAWQAHAEIGAVREQIAARQKALAADSGSKSLATALAAFAAALEPLGAGSGEDTRGLEANSAILAGVESDVEGADRSPTPAQREVAAAAGKRIAEALAAWSKLRTESLPALNRTLAARRQPALAVPDPSELHTLSEPEGEELP